MRLIKRLQEYLLNNNISAYSFGHACGLSNGYLGNQLKGKGAVGSDILERIKENYTDLSLVGWLPERVLCYYPRLQPEIKKGYQN